MRGSARPPLHVPRWGCEFACTSEGQGLMSVTSLDLESYLRALQTKQCTSVTGKSKFYVYACDLSLAEHYWDLVWT